MVFLVLVIFFNNYGSIQHKVAKEHSRKKVKGNKHKGNHHHHMTNVHLFGLGSEEDNDFGKNGRQTHQWTVDVWKVDGWNARENSEGGSVLVLSEGSLNHIHHLWGL